MAADLVRGTVGGRGTHEINSCASVLPFLSPPIYDQIDLHPELPPYSLRGETCDLGLGHLVYPIHLATVVHSRPIRKVGSGFEVRGK